MGEKFPAHPVKMVGQHLSPEHAHGFCVPVTNQIGQIPDLFNHAGDFLIPVPFVHSTIPQPEGLGVEPIGDFL
jgi:hypothetical protein